MKKKHKRTFYEEIQEPEPQQVVIEEKIKNRWIKLRENQPLTIQWIIITSKEHVKEVNNIKK